MINCKTLAAPALAGAAALALASTAAHADPDSYQPYVREPAPATIGVTAGIGMIGFSDDQTNNLIGNGGVWEVRGIFGLHSPLALEAAYRGSAQSVSIPLTDLTLIGNGLEGDLRLNLGSYIVQPYVVGGAGWKHYTLRNHDMQVDIKSDDDVLELPAGAGVSFYAAPVMVDLRGTYRWAFDDEILKNRAEFQQQESLNNWSATARVGVAF